MRFCSLHSRSNRILLKTLHFYLVAFSNRPGFANALDRCRVNKTRKRIENDVKWPSCKRSSMGPRSSVGVMEREGRWQKKKKLINSKLMGEAFLSLYEPNCGAWSQASVNAALMVSLRGMPPAGQTML